MSLGSGGGGCPPHKVFLMIYHLRTHVQMLPFRTILHSTLFFHFEMLTWQKIVS